MDGYGRDLYDFLSGVSRSDAAYHRAASSYDNSSDMAFERAEQERDREEALLEEAKAGRV